MTTLITRVYATESQARSAVTALKGKYSPDRITVDNKSVKGKTVVTFRAEFGTAVPAAKILDAFKPVSSSEKTESAARTGRATVGLSALLDIPELFNIKSRTKLSSDPTPLSTFLQVPVLSKRKPNVTLLNDAAPLSKALNIPTLSKSKPRVTLLDWKPSAVLIPSRKG